MWEGSPNRIEQARTAVNQFLQQKVMDGRKTDHIGLVVFGSANTVNDLAADGGGYQNIEVYRGLDTPTLEMIRYVDSDLVNANVEADCAPHQACMCCVSHNTADLDALVVAMDMIANHTDGKKFFKRIILVTDVGAPSSDDLLDNIVEQLNDKEITLQVLYATFLTILLCLTCSVAGSTLPTPLLRLRPRALPQSRAMKQRCSACRPLSRTCKSSLWRTPLTA